MGVLKFRLAADDEMSRSPDLRRAYVTGLDRTPERVTVEVRDGVLACHRESPESGRLSVPWPVDGFGRPIVATATLAERAEPYVLAVELARGKLNDVRNQAADWTQMGLLAPPDLEAHLADARRAFARAATSQADTDVASAHARDCLAATFRAGQVLTDAYIDQVLQRRLEMAPRLPTLLGCVLEGMPKQVPWSAAILPAINAARVRCTWADLEPAEGQFRWEVPDAQLHWCRRRRLAASAGPLLEFRAGALPDWLWLWEGDYEAIAGMVSELVRQAVGRYKGKVATWHVVGRPASSEVLGLSEDEQIRLTARLLQVARQADPDAHLVVDIDRPWAEWMGSSPFQLGPLHLADSLARAELGLTGIGLEIAPGFAAPGSHLRDTFEFSRLLDLYALLNLPLYVTLAMPSSAAADPLADKSVRIEAGQWPGSINEESQRDWGAEWVALAAAKPFVRAVTWLQPTDAAPHAFPNAGLVRADGTPKLLLDWLRQFRERCLN